MLAAPAERGLKDGHVSKGAVNQGYANFYNDVDGISHVGVYNNSADIVVKVRLTLFHGTLANMPIF